MFHVSCFVFEEEEVSSAHIHTGASHIRHQQAAPLSAVGYGKWDWGIYIYM
jgi:hypothetical protein